MKKEEIELLNNLLKDLDKILSDFLQITGTEFRQISNYIKKVKEVKTNKNALPSLVEELQYFDLLQQKVEHIKSIHAVIKQKLSQQQTQSSATPQATHSVFKLNLLQFEVASIELYKTIDNINNCLNLLDQEDKPQYTAETYNLIIRWVDRIKNMFKSIIDLGLDGLVIDVKEKVSYFETLYSTASERQVLSSYLRVESISPEVIIQEIKTNKADTSASDFLF